MAKWNLDYYSGKDFYSDGDVENEILEIARAGGLQETQEQIKFPVLYHLSPIRENILNWYPFKAEASVLEIGSGCGAITGLLCRKLSKVVSVELSKRRAEVNLARNGRYENLEIRVGNQNDMEFPELFDYVILNGVFEYAMSFTDGGRPYEIFLKNISRFLKPDGVLLVAIENRLGLKYFAGAPEDHTNGYFDGLEGYPGNHSVRTFSKAEWKVLMERCGFGFYRFYYPYPDYKFPKEIFTDESLREQKYGRPAWNFTKYRMELFDETRMADTLQQEEIIDRFANSFLLEMSRAELPREGRVLYVKAGTDRKEEFQILTTIEERRGERVVVKYPAVPEAGAHIRRLSDVQAELNGSGQNTGNTWYPLQGKGEHDSIVYPFVTEKSFGQQAVEAVTRGDLEGVKCLLRRAEQIICGPSAVKRETIGLTGQQDTARFAQVFGPEPVPEALHCSCPANIDLILDNIFEIDGQVRVIDCEWIFDFPVPEKFILWRTINELYCTLSGMEALEKKEDLLAEFGIDREMALLFWKWATYFADEYVGANRLFNRSESLVRVVPEKLCQNVWKPDHISCSLFLDTGDGFSEYEKRTEEMVLDQGHFAVTFDLQEVPSLKALRFDPLEGNPCICKIDREATSVKLQAENGAARTENGDLFLTTDPIYLAPAPEHAAKVTICGKIEVLSMEEALKTADEMLRGSFGNRLGRKFSKLF